MIKGGNHMKDEAQVRDASCSCSCAARSAAAAAAAITCQIAEPTDKLA